MPHLRLRAASAASTAVLAGMALMFPGRELAQTQAPDASVLTPGNNLVIQELPPVPLSLVQRASPYLENRNASFQSWDPRHRELLISTRFAQSAQIHRVVPNSRIAVTGETAVQ